MKWKPIVVGIDDSTESRRAAALAQEIARRARTTCHPIHATRDVWSGVRIVAGRATRPETSALAALSELNRTVVGAVTKQMREAFAPYVSDSTLDNLEVTIGKPGDLLIDAATSHDASLVVIGERKHGRVGRLFGASTAEHLLHHVGTPVIIASPTKPVFSRILVAVDFSDGAAGTIMWTEQLARLFDAKMRVLHVVEVLPDGDAGNIGISQEGFFELCGETFQESIWPYVTLDAAEPSTKQGPTTETIIAEVKDWDADLLVVASHGKGAFESLLLGSTTEKLMHEANVPMFIVPPKAWRLAREEWEEARTGAVAHQ